MALCSHAAICGGCSSQQVPYSEQVAQKQKQLEALFGSQVLPIIMAPTPWRYRNKMEFSFSQDKAKNRYLGLIMRRSRGKVFNLTECLLVSEWFATTVRRVRDWWHDTSLEAFHFHKATGSLRTLTLREGIRTGEKMVMLTVSGNPQYALKKSDIAQLQAALDDPSLSLFIRIQQCIPKQPTQFFEMQIQGPAYIHEEMKVLEQNLRFAISPTSFFQPNTLQAETLYNIALSLIDPAQTDVVFDLYAGTATLGIAVSRKVKQVVAVELNPHAVFDAQMNCKLNHISNVELVCGDVGQILAGLPKADLVIVDPPRAGLDATTIQHLLKMAPAQILYISCNPQAQARDIALLSCYTPRVIQPVDQFPHTEHIENIVLLARNA